MGEELYRKFGFKTVTEYIFLEGEIKSPTSCDANVRPYNASDFTPLMLLDRSISAEDRQQMLQNFMKNTLVYNNGSRITGYFLPDFDEGMILASTDQAGIALLKNKISFKSKCVLPKENETGITFLLSRGFRETNRAPRMILGPKIAWKPQSVFSRAGGFYG